ncbi:cache domain-containing protein [Thermodesulfobacteriota bacterium]
MSTKRKISISTAYLYSMLLITVLSILIVGYLWISYVSNRFAAESDALKTEYIEFHESMVKNEVEKVIDFISYKHSQVEARLKQDIKNRTYEAYEIAMNIYKENKGDKSSSEIEKMAKDALRPIRFNNGRGYFFATELNGVERLFADRPELEGKNLIGMQDTKGKFVIKDMIDIVKDRTEDFYEYTWTKPNAKGKDFPKIAFVKHFEPFDWFIGTGEYLDDVDEDIQKEVLNRIEQIRFGKNGYIFAGSWDGLTLSGPAKGKNMYDVTDANGVKIVQKLIAYAKTGGGFVRYVMPGLDGKKSAPKISYADGINAWKWYVGAGVYIDEIDQVIAKKKIQLQEEVRFQVLKITATLIALIVFTTIIGKFTSSKAKKSFEVFLSFFEKAAAESASIDENEVYFSEFSKLASSANQMVADRKHSETALKESEERLRSFYDAAFEGIAITEQGKFIDLNSRFAEIFGYEYDELIGRAVMELVAEEDRELVSGHIRSDFQEPYEHKALHKDGSILFVEVQGRQAQFHGRPVRVTAIHDISERKRSENAIRESENKFRTLFEFAPDVYYLHDMNGHFIDGNKTAENLLGYKKEELIGKNLFELDLLSEEGLKKAAENIAENLAGKLTGPDEYILKDKFGRQIVVEIRAIPIDYGGQNVVLGIARDISERKRAEEERKRLETQLAQAQKMESIGTLAGGVAHDFNNILSPIILHTEMMLEDTPAENPLRLNLEEIHSASMRARDLIKQILTFSRQTEKERIPLILDSIIREAIKMLRSSLPSTVEIRQNIESGVGPVLADPTQIHQIMLNLCTNAAHAMREKGGILEASLVDVDLNPEDTAHIPDLEPGQYVKLTVSDTGAGMESSVKERIFEPYFTTKEKGEGTGLGLSVVHGIAKSYNGAILVDSEPGKGTTFQIFLPQTKRRISSKSASAVQYSGGNERVLLIDDERSMLTALQQMLERLGYTVDARMNGVEALEIFRADPGEFDLIITDYTMPEVTGADLAREVMGIRPDIPVILCTGYSDQMDEEKSKAMGIRAFVMKPIVMGEMAETIRKVIENDT